MHNIYRTRIRTSKQDPTEYTEWYHDTRDQANQYVTETIKDRTLKGQYVGSVEITPVEVASMEAAYDYNYPYGLRMTNRR